MRKRRRDGPRLPHRGRSAGIFEVRPSAADRPIASVSALPVPPPESRTKGTPLARRLARQHGIDLDGVRGSGPSGRITMADVEATAKASAQSPTVDAQKGRADLSIDLGTRVPAGPIQTAMARRLTAVKQEVPHFYLAAEAEVTTLLALRESLNTDPGNPRITINHMVVAAVGRALARPSPGQPGLG